MTFPDDRRPALQPPRFRLVTMLLVIGLLCVTFAVLGVVEPYAAFALILSSLAILAHVAANAIGTRLRDLGNTPEAALDQKRATVGRRPLEQCDFAPTTHLGQRDSLGPLVVIVTCIGTFAGGALGGLLFLTVYWERANPVNIGIGILAFAIMGAIGSFAFTAFVQAIVKAIAQANQHEK